MFFKGSLYIALINVGDSNTQSGFYAAELEAGPKSATRDSAVSYSQASGLGKPEAVVSRLPVYAASFLAALPLYVMAAYGAIIAAIFLWKAHPAARQAVIFALAIGFAAMLPTLLGALPPQLVPGRWSDFSFWESIAKGFAESVKEFLSAPGRLRDAEGKMLLLKQACLSFACTLCALSACFRWSGSNKDRMATKQPLGENDG